MTINTERSIPDVRLATVKDAQQIASLIGRVWVKNFGWSVTPADIEHLRTETLSLANVTSEIEDSLISYIVATLPTYLPASETVSGGDEGPRETVIGIIQLVSGTSEPCLRLLEHVELRRLYVDDGYHGMGVAQKLFAFATELSRKDGCKSMWLGVWEENPRGQAFYRKMGFESVGEHTFMVGQSVRRDLVMERSI